MLPKHTIYKFSVENLRSISAAITQLKRTIHKAIATENNSLVASLTRLFALTLGAWSETRLHKLLYEADAFSNQEIEIFQNESTQFGKWQKTVEIAIRSHYNVPNAPLDDVNLSFSVSSKYQVLQNVLDTHLRPVIEIRNKLAHGQWIYPFTGSLDLSQQCKIDIEKENVLSLQFKHLMLNHLSQIIHDLVVSMPTFERDFDKNYRKFVGVRENLIRRPFNDYCIQLKERHEIGKSKKIQNIMQQN